MNMNLRMREQSEDARDIGDLPPPVDTARKELCKFNFRLFLESYFSATFTLAWSPDQLKVIGKIETAVLKGGLFAMAMPRGSGKTSFAECAVLWATTYGHHDFVCLIGSDEAAAQDMLKSVKAELENNDTLLDDFPEVCVPIRALEGISLRCKGQTYRGERTQIGWVAKELVLPTIPGSPASGAVVRVAGLTGRIRGMKFKRPDGGSVRPSLVVLDDPQTDESARSPAQCATRESIIAGAVLGLAGPGKKISGIMPCTVVRPDDMADRLLDRERHPDWQGERTKMVYRFPTNEKLWDQYFTMRSSELQAGGDGAAATAFYRDHRDEMDAGAVVAWPERFNPDELSAIQSAMNLRMRDEAAFFAEYQNEPLLEDLSDVVHLTPEQVAHKLNRTTRGTIPVEAEYVTGFIDIHDAILYWMVCAWTPGFNGWVIDYGVYPRQIRSYFTMRQATSTLRKAAPNMGLEGAIYAGLESLVTEKATTAWAKSDGTVLHIYRLLLDAGYKPSVVHQICLQSPHAAILKPHRGEGVTAGKRPISTYDKTRGDFIGDFWWVPKATVGRAVRTLHGDVNYWKSFVRDRLLTPMGEPGCLSLFGDRPTEHKLLADHLTAETAIKTEGHGRIVEEWTLLPNRDNHYLDCLVGCAIAASTLGCKLTLTPKIAPLASRPTKLVDLQKSRRNLTQLRRQNAR